MEAALQMNNKEKLLWFGHIVGSTGGSGGGVSDCFIPLRILART